jgi:hypothetical protein
MWWLSPADFNSLATQPDVGTGLSLPLASSYVVAEDGGQYPNNSATPTQRLPSTGGLNYYIHSVEFETVIGLNSSSKHSNMLNGTVVIYEPYGATFQDTLVFAAVDANTGLFYNHTSQPYMLQCDFVGYDDTGTPVPTSETAIYRKRFPIRILSMKVDIDETGGKYTIDFVAANHMALKTEYGHAPKIFNLHGTTVQDVLNDYAAQLNAFYNFEVANRKGRQYAPRYAFTFDPNFIQNSNVVYSENVDLANANPNTPSTQLDLKTSTFTVPYGTSIIETIHKIMLQSQYILNQLNIQVGSNSQTVSLTEVQSAKLTTIFNMYKTTIQTTMNGVPANASSPIAGAYDYFRNEFALSFTFNIGQYYVLDSVHPMTPMMADSRPYVIKDYQYMYTGKNNDVLKFDLNFDYSWYLPVTTYNYAQASQTATKNTNTNILSSDSPYYMVGPSWLVGAGDTIFGTYPILNPLRYRPVVGIQQQEIGPGNIGSDPNKQLSSDVVHTQFTNSKGDMINLELTIVGDPTLLKQDDWLYIPSPSSTVYNSWDTLSQSDFCAKYGHARMDSGMLIVNMTVNTVIDIDTDWQDTGLMTPPTPIKNLFSGLYKIITIKSSFSEGQFTQVLSMVRTSLSDTITNSAPDKSSTNGASARAQAGSISNNFVTGTSAQVGGSASVTQTNTGR